MKLKQTAPYKSMTHEEYILTLRAMPDAEKFRLACELNDQWRARQKTHYRRYFPGMCDAEFDRVYRERRLIHVKMVCERERLFYDRVFGWS